MSPEGGFWKGLGWVFWRTGASRSKGNCQARREKRATKDDGQELKSFEFAKNIMQNQHLPWTDWDWTAAVCTRLACGSSKASESSECFRFRPSKVNEVGPEKNVNSTNFECPGLQNLVSQEKTSCSVSGRCFRNNNRTICWCFFFWHPKLILEIRTILLNRIEHAAKKSPRTKVQPISSTLFMHEPRKWPFGHNTRNPLNP